MKVMLFRFILGIDLLNLPVNLTHFTGTAQNKRAFYFSISSDSPTSNKRNEFAEKIAYMLPKGMHTFAYCNYRVFFEFMGKLITNTSVFMFMCAVKSFPFHRICLNFVHRKTNTFRRVFFFLFRTFMITIAIVFLETSRCSVVSFARQKKSSVSEK